MSDPRDAFVIHRLRAKPVEYSFKITHYVRDGEWMLGIEVNDLAEDDETRRRLAADLREIATWLEEPRSQNRQPAITEPPSAG